jgi:hypothetical protein
MTPAKLLAYVRKNPGLTCAAIAAAFGGTPAHVGVELRALRAAGELKSKGATRGTTYTAVGK